MGVAPVGLAGIASWASKGQGEYEVVMREIARDEKFVQETLAGAMVLSHGPCN